MFSLLKMDLTEHTRANSLCFHLMNLSISQNSILQAKRELNDEIESEKEDRTAKCQAAAELKRIESRSDGIRNALATAEERVKAAGVQLEGALRSGTDSDVDLARRGLQEAEKQRTALVHEVDLMSKNSVKALDDFNRAKNLVCRAVSSEYDRKLATQLQEAREAIIAELSTPAMQQAIGRFTVAMMHIGFSNLKMLT